MAKPDPIKDIAYRLMSRGSKESRDLKAIDRAIQEYYYNMPYMQAYTGHWKHLGIVKQKQGGILNYFNYFK